ncbi:hypothetical protein PLANTIT3_10005 [Plantibacter sp. T3]|nr:hypothetical protein PLANTIT3_10005 [Plantibacter sp. T3]
MAAPPALRHVDRLSALQLRDRIEPGHTSAAGRGGATRAPFDRLRDRSVPGTPLPAHRGSATRVPFDKLRDRCLPGRPLPVTEPVEVPTRKPPRSGHTPPGH